MPDVKEFIFKLPKTFSNAPTSEPSDLLTFMF